MATELTLPVTGMTCGGCENAVKRALGAMPGVSAVTASQADARVVVTFDEGVLSKDAITKKIGALGYTVGAAA